ncbi:MAG: 5-nitroimidazole antibiotic resistance protein [Bacteroidetes bacterium 4572_77]|nr:MAG: 5-nitroimidazole antibiotic resistance protein [Bacteroidetes bacterium 4572_77]
MTYSNQEVRRQDRLLNEEAAVLLLKDGEYGVLSMRTKEDAAYGIPINYVWDEKNSIYLHCAPHGRKLDLLDKYPEASFCVVGKTKVISNKFTTKYESIIIDCVAVRNLSEEEKKHALYLLLDKYSPEDKVIGMKYVEKSFHRTEIIRLDLQNWSGKTKVIK